MQRAFTTGWRDVVKPLVSDDRPPGRGHRQPARGGQGQGIGGASSTVHRNHRPGCAVAIGATPARAGRGPPPRSAAAPDGGWPHHPHRPGRARLDGAAAHDRLGHPDRAAAVDGGGLEACTPALRAAQEIRRGGGALRPRRLQPADRAAPAGRAWRTGRTGQHDGVGPERHAGRQACPAAGHQPRTSIAAHPRAPERRTGARRRRAGCPAARSGRNARPDHQPAGERAPRPAACCAAPRACRPEIRARQPAGRAAGAVRRPRVAGVVARSLASG